MKSDRLFAMALEQGKLAAERAQAAREDRILSNAEFARLIAAPLPTNDQARFPVGWDERDAVI